MNPETATSTANELLKLGLPGVVIIGLAVAVIWLARKYDKLQEKRHSELVELSEQLSKVVDRNTEAFIKQTASFDYLNDHCSLVSPRRGRMG